MIVSHKHKFIFVEVPKTGTTTIRDYFIKNLALKTIYNEEVDILKDDFITNNINNKFNNYMKAEDIRKLLPEKIWNNYFKFCFVRNPFDREVSKYFFYRNGRVAEGIKTGIVKDKNTIKLHKSTISLPFKTWILKNNGHNQFNYINSGEDIIINFVGKFENLGSDFNRICNRLKLPIIELLQSNSTSHEHYSKYYDN